MTALVTLEHVHRLGQVFTEPDYYPRRRTRRSGSRRASG